MYIVVWILHVVLALHTFMGAAWKFANPEQNVGSLQAIPHGVWLGLGVLEVICSVALILAAFNRRLTLLAPVAAIFIAAEMLMFCGVHLASGDDSHGHMIYWLVVAVISCFVGYGRFVERRS